MSGASLNSVCGPLLVSLSRHHTYGLSEDRNSFLCSYHVIQFSLALTEQLNMYFFCK